VSGKFRHIGCYRIDLEDMLPVRVQSLSAMANSLTWKEVVFLMVALDTKAVRVALVEALTLVMGATRTEAVEKATVEAISRGVERDTISKIKESGTDTGVLRVHLTEKKTDQVGGVRPWKLNFLSGI